MKTDAVMCIAFTSARPSRTLLSSMQSCTCFVTLMKATLVGVLNQSSLRWDFIVFRPFPLLSGVSLHGKPGRARLDTLRSLTVTKHESVILNAVEDYEQRSSLHRYHSA